MKPLRQSLALGPLGMMLLVVSGCSINPQPLTQAEMDEFAADKQSRMISDEQVPVTQSIDLYEAIARALKYNLDHRLEVADRRLRNAEFEEAEVDMLPELVAKANWSDRNNDPFSTSITEEGSLENSLASTSADPGSTSGSLELTWDILDFGLSYYRAKQAGDKFFIAEEQRRSTVNRLLEDVRTAYWRTVAAERHLDELKRLERRTQNALEAARQQVRQGEGGRLEALRYQREMLDTLKTAKELRRDLFVAKNQLAALMNLPQGQEFSVVMPRHPELQTPITTLSPEAMTEAALRNRPEMREVAYRLRINKQEEKATVLEMLPSIRGYLGANFDTNDFLVNQNWTGWGARVSWDLMSLAQYPARQQAVEYQGKLLDARALALTQSIATQVYVAHKRFTSLQDEVEIAEEYHETSQRIFAQARNEYEAGFGSQREMVREQLKAILASLRFDATYAEMQGAFANVHAAMGLNAYDGEMSGQESLKEIEAALRDLWRERGDMVQTSRSTSATRVTG
ncbi:hypothetical protein HHA01_02110 [Halomonas halmophila]|uniref:Transporter n=2 Tax=Halomonas halmophila TaxID=252 RepID=A0A4Y4F074_9GAMM|nr:hypothetical protein HHA01_02110 [Halomonas halmophila]